MRPSDALDMIREKFIPDRGHAPIVKETSEETFLEILEAIEGRLPYPDGPTGRAILFFLYCGCIKFDRWMATPYLIKSSYRETFDKFVSMLLYRSGDFSNGARFLIDQMKWDLFSTIDRKNLAQGSSIMELVNEFEERLKRIPMPAIPVKQNEFKQLSGELSNLLLAVRTNGIRTLLRTKIPIVPVDAQFTINTKWNGIETKVMLNPVWINPSNTMLNPGEGLRLIPTTPSQWQNGYCEIQIECKALLDHTVRKEPLAIVLADQSPPEAEWSLLFVNIYEIVDAVIWRLREQHKMTGRWILLPTDIATVEWQLHAGEYMIGHAHKDPLLMLRGTNEPIKEVVVEIDIENRVEWHSRSYWLANSYLGTGEINEALFWINVAADA